MFASCATLRPYLPQLDIIFTDWHAYKGQVPTAGAILLNESCDKVPSHPIPSHFHIPALTPPTPTASPQVLLVKGWKANASWGFPKGKKNKDEDDDKAAVREVGRGVGGQVAVHLKKNKQEECMNFPHPPIPPSPHPPIPPSQVFEETDFDLTALINPRSYLEVCISKQRCRLFLVPGVPENAPFQPRTSKEISVSSRLPPLCAEGELLL